MQLPPEKMLCPQIFLLNYRLDGILNSVTDPVRCMHTLPPSIDNAPLAQDTLWFL